MVSSAAVLLSALSVVGNSQSSHAETANLIVRVHAPIVLRVRPGGPPLRRIGAKTEFGSPRTLAVTAQSGHWLAVPSEDLPPGVEGWVDDQSPRITVARTRLSILVRLGAKTLELRRGSRVLRRFTVGTGAAVSPTPTGRFAVTDKRGGKQYGRYLGCCILVLNVHQRHLPPGWQGGDRVAIHGTDAPSTIGRAASAGCLHATDANLRYLMRLVPLGTPVLVRP
jgi:lipoprotein-anchoring transpeptidase ErfK/SrfK